MERERILAFGHEQLELQRRQEAAEPHIEVATTLEEVQEKYADLAERITALPPRESERIKDTPSTPTGRFLDRYVTARFETGDKEIPFLQLTLQTGHHVDEHDNYDRRASTYIVIDWMATGADPNSLIENGQSVQMNVQKESLGPPTAHSDVPETSRMLGLIEESVAEAEKALLTVQA